jgi:hypothetical protein
MITQDDNGQELLRISLSYLQDNCYGLFYNKYVNTYECIVNESDEKFTTIVVGQLLGFSTDIRYHSEDNDKLIIRFPDGKSLTEMLQDPIEFNDWYKNNTKNN